MRAGGRNGSMTGVSIGAEYNTTWRCAISWAVDGALVSPTTAVTKRSMSHRFMSLVRSRRRGAVTLRPR